MKKILLSIAFFTIIISLAGCTGGPGTSSEPQGVNPGIPSVVQLLDVQNIVQTNSYVYFKAKILDGNGNPVKNEPVTFTNLSSIGRLSSTSANTDSLGYATVTLFSPVSGFATVQAEVNTGAGQVRDRRTVYYTSSNSLNLYPYLILEVDGNDNGIYNETDDFYLFENTDDNSVIIRATVYNGIGWLISGSTVTFETDAPYKVGTDPDAECSDGSTTCEVVFPSGNTATTNYSGEASVVIQVFPETLITISRVLNVTAWAGNGAFGITSLFLYPVTVDTVDVSANPPVVDSGSDSTSLITAMVTTTAGNPVPDGTSVNFTASTGGIEPFAQTTDGIAEAKFTAPDVTANTSATITASVGGVSDSTTVMVLAPEVDLAVLPSTLTVDGVTGGTATFTIFNGTPGYNIFSSDSTLPPSPTYVASSGGSFTVTVPAGTPDTTVTYTVMDAAGDTKDAILKIEVEEPTALAISPTSVDLTDGPAPQTFLFQVTGGVPPYNVISSDSSVVFNDDGAGGGIAGDGIINGSEGGTWTVPSDGATFTATIPANAVGADTTVTLTVTDSGGSPIVTATLNITN